MSDNKK
jgi:hypothetical protein